MAWFKKEKTPKLPAGDRRFTIPEGLWVKCDNCKEIIYKKEVARNANVCPKCNYHFRISARERLETMYDDGRFREFDTEIARRSTRSGSSTPRPTPRGSSATRKRPASRTPSFRARG